MQWSSPKEADPRAFSTNLQLFRPVGGTAIGGQRIQTFNQGIDMETASHQHASATTHSSATTSAAPTPTYNGRCFCGAVELTVTGAPVVAGFCHCESCRSWSASPVNAFTLWKPEAVRITKGENKVGVFNKTPKSYRKFCTNCGGHLLTEHPLWELVDVYAATIPTLRHEPQVHVNYQETVLRIKDGLPKMKDVPKEMGGSGETLLE